MNPVDKHLAEQAELEERAEEWWKSTPLNEVQSKGWDFSQWAKNCHKAGALSEREALKGKLTYLRNCTLLITAEQHQLAVRNMLAILDGILKEGEG